MNYRSFSDLSRVIANNLHRIPETVDLIVGIPRSGMIPAYSIGLAANRPVTDTAGLIGDKELQGGLTRDIGRKPIRFPREATHVLVVDDSMNSGASLAATREALTKAALGAQITYAVVYASPTVSKYADICFELLPYPRMFEWNVMHHPMLRRCCVDIDGILCVDPTEQQNDDGDSYRTFLRSAERRFVPTVCVGALVSSRLEKYRRETETWLAKHKIEYESLFLLDLPDARTRREMNIHAQFKADVYRSVARFQLFIESEEKQAEEIAQISGKPVLCLPEQKLVSPGLSRAFITAKSASLSEKVRRRVNRMKGRVLLKRYG